MNKYMIIGVAPTGGPLFWDNDKDDWSIRRRKATIFSTEEVASEICNKLVTTDSWADPQVRRCIAD